MFREIKDRVEHAAKRMSKGKVLRVGLERNELFDAYLEALPIPLRQEHTCNCCKSFLRQYGGLVSVINGELKTLWDFEVIRLGRVRSVDRIIGIKLAEDKERKEAGAKAVLKTKLLEALANKQDAALNESSVEDLEKRLAELD